MERIILKITNVTKQVDIEVMEHISRYCQFCDISCLLYKRRSKGASST